MKNRLYINLELSTYRMLGDYREMKKTLERERCGYAGEQLVNRLIEESYGQNFLNNVMLEVDSNYFQIDHLIATTDKITIFDTKNHASDFEVIDEKWQFLDGKEASNPIRQATRAQDLMNRWLINHGISLPVWSFVVWCGEGQVYGLDKNSILIGLNKTKRIIQRMHQQSAPNEALLSLIDKNRIIKNPFHKKIELGNTYKTGLNCPQCYQMSFEGIRKKLKCKNCGEEFHIQDIVYQNILFYCSLKDASSFNLREIKDFVGDATSTRSLQVHVKQLVEHKMLIKGEKRTYKLPDQIERLL